MIPSLSCTVEIYGETFLCCNGKLSTVFGKDSRRLKVIAGLAVSETDVLMFKNMHPIFVLVAKEKPVGENTQWLYLQIKNGSHFYSGKEKKRGHVSLMFHLIALSIFTVSFSLLK